MWTVRFTQDTTVARLGTLSASNGPVIYSRRVDTRDAADVRAFVAEAKAQQTAVDADRVTREAIEAAAVLALEAP